MEINLDDKTVKKTLGMLREMREMARTMPSRRKDQKMYHDAAKKPQVPKAEQD